jgi:hypothetical protein
MTQPNGWSRTAAPASRFRICSLESGVVSCRQNNRLRVKVLVTMETAFKPLPTILRGVFCL